MTLERLRAGRFGRAATAAVALTATLGLLAGCAGGTSSSGGSTGDTVYFGVSAPLTGQYAEYGKFWKDGFGLALDDVNADGGIDGRKVALKWEDTQSDPKQSTTVAQKFVADKSVIAELGDFASPASMAASPIYQRNKLVQYGFTNSSPDFTKGGTYMWSPQTSQDVAERQQTKAVAQYGKTVAVLYQDTDWGKAIYDIFRDEAKEQGITVTSASSYLPSTTDFRPLLLKARKANPEVVYDLGYDNDAAAIAKQVRTIGWDDVTVFTQQFSATAIKLAGDAAEGVVTTTQWWPESDEPRIKKFVEHYKEKYDGAVPGAFEVYSYDALQQLVAAARTGGATREGVYEGLQKDKKLPSVQIGEFAFDAQRRPPLITFQPVVVKDGVQVLDTAGATPAPTASN